MFRSFLRVLRSNNVKKVKISPPYLKIRSNFVVFIFYIQWYKVISGGMEKGALDDGSW